MSTKLPFSRRVIDPLNSIAWFAMDTFWLFEIDLAAYLFAVLTVASGIWLVVRGWREDRKAALADLGLLCWIAMNTVWMVSDLSGSKPPPVFCGCMATLGGTLIALAVWRGQDVRRLRIHPR